MSPEFAESKERSVLTLGSLCLPCCIRNTSCSWFNFNLIYFIYYTYRYRLDIGHLQYSRPVMAALKLGFIISRTIHLAKKNPKNKTTQPASTNFRTATIRQPYYKPYTTKKYSIDTEPLTLESDSFFTNFVTLFICIFDIYIFHDYSI